ncbi:MAG: Hpt domain-containing protein [Oscillospiraceae bacterium]|nr:Hpt domain-containing protein [Oscillospiraceae bacterium]
MNIDSLKAYGADTDEGLARCMNMADFYLKMVNMAIAEDKVSVLRSQLEQGDLDAAFETAHAMKGVWGNLSVTPMYDAVSRITELLRGRTQTDYSPLMDEISSLYDKLKAL